MERQNFVMFCQQDWHVGIGTNARSLAKEFAKHHAVLYVNTPLDGNSELRGHHRPEVRHKLRVLAGRAPALAPAGPGLWVWTPGALCLSLNWLPAGRVFAALNRFNGWLLARSIRKAARAVGFEQYVLVQDGLVFQGLALKPLLRPRRFVYYLRDYMLAVPYFQRHGPAVEQGLLARADVVAANSAYLQDYARQTNPRSYDIGQGCDLAQAPPPVPGPAPADLAAVPGRRIGYVGYLTHLRLDLDLLLAIAHHRPDWSLVLVGPEDDVFARSALHQLPNVYFLGGKAPAQLPAYLAHFDVCINPQAVNGLTVGNYPLKIDEYLFMGKPVVATHTRTMELFAGHVHLAHSPAEWLLLLERALTEEAGNPQLAPARTRFAQAHTWAASAAKLYQALDALG